MRRIHSTGLVFTGILLVSLATSCGNKDESKETASGEGIKVEATEHKGKDIESQAQQGQEPLPRVILITTSEACDCALERCAKGEKAVVELVQQYPRRFIFERLDYARERTPVAQLLKEHQLQYLPALLLFDAEGTLKVRRQGFFDKKEIEKDLETIGVL